MTKRTFTGLIELDSSERFIRLFEDVDSDKSIRLNLSKKLRLPDNIELIRKVPSTTIVTVNAFESEYTIDSIPPRTGKSLCVFEIVKPKQPSFKELVREVEENMKKAEQKK